MTANGKKAGTLRVPSGMFLLEGKFYVEGSVPLYTSWLKLVGFKHLVQCLKYKHKWGGSYSEGSEEEASLPPVG